MGVRFDASTAIPDSRMAARKDAREGLDARTASCAFCNHANPPESKFCNECGADLNLTLCQACDAVNHRGMSECHKCGVPLREQSMERTDTVADTVAETAADTVQASDAPLPEKRRRISPLIVVGFVVAAAGALFALQRFAEIRPPTTASNVLPSARDSTTEPTQTDKTASTESAKPTEVATTEPPVPAPAEEGAAK